MSEPDASVIAHRRAQPKKRNLKKVPFVELAGGRLQGVVSSGSDISRVYVSFFTAGSHDYYCSTNNNRPCGGLRGSSCKHLQALVTNAVAQYGAPRVARFLEIDADPEQMATASDVLTRLHGSQIKAPASEVFSRVSRFPAVHGLARPGRAVAGDELVRDRLSEGATVDLSTLPDGVREAGAVSAGLDRCLVHGFARLGDSQKEDLDALARVFTGSPLAEGVAQAAAAVRSGITLEEALRALAFARIALDGARHDALLAQAAEGSRARSRCGSRARPSSRARRRHPGRSWVACASGWSRLPWPAFGS